MTFADMFKNSILEGFNTDVTMGKVAAGLLAALLSALFILFVYRMTMRGIAANRGYEITLLLVTAISAMIVLTITSNLALSLGMVGALSIVRFRTAIKDPIDLMFLFWSISVGIICGAGLAQVAVILSIVMTLGILILDQLPVARAPMILVVNATDLDMEERIAEIVTEYDKHFKVKSRNMTASSLDMVIELRTGKGGELVRNVLRQEGVRSASLLSHDGEVTF